MTRPRPTPEQIAATDPSRSNWVGANAGSGKTHVLTQRVARLLLDGAEPQKILCLTYTRAAAAEMQSRLFRTLGKWAMAPAEDLGRTLADLGGVDEVVTDTARLALARRLFARALETPGGLKIQTIHAFCTEVLRRFPLEAGVSPRFEVADDRRSRALLAEVRAAMAEAAADAFDCAARTLNEGDIDALALSVLRCRAELEGDLDSCLAAHFGAAAIMTPAELAAAALNELDKERLESLRAALLAHGGKTEQALAEAFSAWLSGQCADAGIACDGMGAVLLTKDGAPRRSGLPTRALLAARPDATDEIAWLQDWAARARDAVRSAGIVARVRDLYGFAGDLLQRHDGAKLRQALLDFDDLVRRSRALLADSNSRAWVLWKLDQGIDHVLVDEAQDTAPPQWEVVAAIADEFFAGAGARPEGRSIFVVGDEKQSIYSFQGAEPNAFGRMRGHFGDRLEAGGTPLGRPNLETSYRSAPAILQYVDAVFQGEAGQGLTVTGDPVRHAAHREGAHGRVELWPVIEPAEKDEEAPWYEPVDAVPASDTKLRLAEAVAERIAAMIGREWLGPRPPERPARPVRAGDVLVLVARRDRLAAGIVRELKGRGVPVAGADRMVLTDEIAVQDLLALAKVACLPGDDLSLAALLKSPLCGLSEEELFALAHGREGRLWDEVKRSDHQEIAAFLSDMAAQVDFLRPYEFFERALVRHDGRRRLLARLGPEAEDAIDELLSQALSYEHSEPPSLTGFVAWIEADEITVKREMESGADAVRVMTVHGAKGLEAPVVILPDTISGGRPNRGPLLLPAPARGNAPGLTLWLASKEEDDAIAAAAREEGLRREKAERKRLLYVALTRAEDWLILCGAGLRRAPGDSWYGMLKAGMEALPGVTALPSPTGEGEMLRFETGPAPVPDAEAPAAVHEAPPPLPSWLSRAPAEARRVRASPSALAPSTPHSGAGIGRELALTIGSAVHRLLERLPEHPESRHEVLAEQLLAHEFPALAPEHRQAAWHEAARVMGMTEAAAVFGPDALAEVAAAIPVPGGERMIGRIDRLLVGPDEVLIVDFKTDRVPPATASAVPRTYLAQMGAYRTAVAGAFPRRRIGAALLWTAGPHLMRVEPGVIDLAFRESLITSRNIDSAAAGS